MSRVFVISDIHGRYNEFIKLIKYIQLTKDDFLINLGDMVDRGPDSSKVVEWFSIMQQSTKGKVQSIKGNHEELFLGYLSGKVDEEYYLNNFIGGKKTLESYEDLPKKKVYEHLDYIKSLPLYIEMKDYILVHGGLDLDKPLSKQTSSDTAWDENKLYQRDERYKGKKIIYGHTPTLYIYEHYGMKGYEIWKSANHIAIDCSFSKARKLLIYDLTNDKEYYYDFSTKKCYRKDGKSDVKHL